LRIRYATSSDGRLVKKALVYTNDEHQIQRSRVDTDAIHIVRRLKDAGHETYIVGGAVRDLILGKTPKDFDIVTNATPSRIKKIFRNCRIIGKRFKLVHVYYGQKIFEVSTFRSIKDGHTGNTYGIIDEDVLRRDFTMNALFYDPIEEVVVDYIGGVKDIHKKIIRPIIPLTVIFKDDPVRMIRAVKYSATTGFKLPLSLSRKIHKQSSLLATISPSRRTEEYFKILGSGFSAIIVERLLDFDLYEYLQPQATSLMQQNVQYRENYLNRLRELDTLLQKEKTLYPGELLLYTLKDYIDNSINWNMEALELYRSTFKACRQFIMPLNPPRIHLEYAVRNIFWEHGIGLQKGQLLQKHRPEQSSMHIRKKIHHSAPVSE
jgi:poly(A) polymerase